MTPHDAISWSFGQNFHADKMNACIHTVPVRFSPLTFRLAEILLATWPDGEDITAELAEVRSHLGAYAEDPGR